MFVKTRLLMFTIYHAFLEGWYKDQEPKKPHNAKSLAHKFLKEQGSQEFKKLK